MTEKKMYISLWLMKTIQMEKRIQLQKCHQYLIISVFWLKTKICLRKMIWGEKSIEAFLNRFSNLYEKCVIKCSFFSDRSLSSKRTTKFCYSVNQCNRRTHLDDTRIRQKLECETFLNELSQATRWCIIIINICV